MNEILNTMYNEPNTGPTEIHQKISQNRKEYGLCKMTYPTEENDPKSDKFNKQKEMRIYEYVVDRISWLK